MYSLRNLRKVGRQITSLVPGFSRGERFVSQVVCKSVNASNVLCKFSSFGSFDTGGPRCVSVTIASGIPVRSFS